MPYKFKACSLLPVILIVSSCAFDGVEAKVKRGDFSVVGNKQAAAKFEKISKEKISGYACSTQIQEDAFANDPVIQWAVWSALAEHPEATALVDVTAEQEGSCMRVYGYPARYKNPRSN